MPLNTPENVSSVIQALLGIARSGRDADSLLDQVGLSRRELNLVERSLSGTLSRLQRIAGLQDRVEETILRIQGTSGSEQRRLARQEASRNEAKGRSDMRYAELLGRFGIHSDSQGNLSEISRRDYLTQKYYNQFAEFDDTGFVANREEARRTARILADAQISQEQAEEDAKARERAAKEQESRREANRLAQERYTDAIESINDPFYLKRKELYNRFLEVDPNTGISTPQQKEEASAKAREVLRLTIEKKANEFVNNNNKETSKNTQELSVLNKRLFPFLSYFMPAGILGMGMSTIREDVSTSRTGLSYRNFTEAYLNSREGKKKYKAFEDMYFSQGGQWQGAKKAFSREADWISNVRFGYGRERIRDLAIRGLKIPNEIIRTGDISGLMDYYASVIPKMSPEQYKLLKSSGLLDETMLFGFRNANRPWGGKERISHLSGSAEKYLATTPFGQRGSWIGEQVSNTIGYWLSATLPSWVLSAPNMTPTVSDMFHGRFFYDPYEDSNRRTTVNPIINQNITVGTPEEANRISGERMAEAMVSTLPNAER